MEIGLHVGGDCAQMEVKYGIVAVKVVRRGAIGGEKKLCEIMEKRSHYVQLMSLYILSRVFSNTPAASRTLLPELSQDYMVSLLMDRTLLFYFDAINSTRYKGSAIKKLVTEHRRPSREIMRSIESESTASYTSSTAKSIVAWTISGA